MVLTTDNDIKRNGSRRGRVVPRARIMAVPSPGARGLTSQYDGMGNRTRLSARIGGGKDFANSYSYDALSRLDEIDQQGQTGGNAVAEKSVYYGLDAIGDVTAIDRANTVDAGPQQNGPAYSVLSYSATTGQLTGINHEYMGSSLDDLTYTYDAVGRVSTFGSIDGTATYGYDPMSQLTSATYTTAAGGHQPANESYSFDTNGNRTADGGTATTPGTGNLLASDGTFDFVYDGNGNMVSRTRISDAPASDHQTKYTWDAANRLTDVEIFSNAGTLTEYVHYAYDVFGRLIERELDPTGGGTYTQAAHYVWDDGAQPASGVGGSSGGTVLAFDGNGELTTRYLNGPNTSAYDQYYTTQAEEDVVTPAQQGTVNWDLLDNQASVRDIANSEGTLVDHISYNSNGLTAYEQDPSVEHLLGWQGGITDAATGQEHFGFRWYDLADAVWSEPDPIGFLAGSMNLTESRGNDPANVVDPSGEITIYVHGVNTNNEGYDDLRRQARKYFPKKGGECDEQTIDLNWAYKSAGGKVDNPPLNASDSIGNQKDAGGAMSKGMSPQQFQGANKLKEIIAQLQDLIANNPCLAGEEINIVAHSQGTNISLSVLQKGWKVNNVVFMGSPLDKEIVASASNNTNLAAGAKSATAIHNLWSSEDGWAGVKGGIGAYGLPPKLISGGVTDTELDGVNHAGAAGWWKGAWLDKKPNRDAVEAYFRAVLYTKSCGCGAKVKAEITRIQQMASGYMKKGNE